jgi:hypothetical protein
MFAPAPPQRGRDPEWSRLSWRRLAVVAGAAGFVVGFVVVRWLL